MWGPSWYLERPITEVVCPKKNIVLVCFGLTSLKVPSLLKIEIASPQDPVDYIEACNWSTTLEHDCTGDTTLILYMEHTYMG
jgi:hypothetical protein